MASRFGCNQVSSTCGTRFRAHVETAYQRHCSQLQLTSLTATHDHPVLCLVLAALLCHLLRTVLTFLPQTCVLASVQAPWMTERAAWLAGAAGRVFCVPKYVPMQTVAGARRQYSVNTTCRTGAKPWEIPCAQHNLTCPYKVAQESCDPVAVRCCVAKALRSVMVLCCALS